MRLRTFTAPTMPEAMALVRRELGPDAIILSTGKGERGGIAVTAAHDATPPAAPPLSEPAPDPAEAVHEALFAHGTPARLAEALLAAAVEVPAEDPVLTLAAGLDAVFAFAPLSHRKPSRPLMLVGPPGAGKTVSVAKLATRAVLAGQKPKLVSWDIVRAGGFAQLEALAGILGLPLHRAESERQLAELAAPKGEETVLIDSPGINPYNSSDRAELAAHVAATAAEPVFVLPAGGDAFDAIEMARAFRALGCARLLVTRLDMVHRLGSLLGAAHEARLAFSDAGITPDVAQGLTPLTPVALARLLLPEPAPAAQPLTREPATP
jgi:flagellar biosynthesis protein FlhF